MSFLYWLAELRTPVLDTIMQLITHFGEELLLIGIAMVIMWCVNKSEGYYLLTVSLIGIQINQLLKVLFRVERPWDIDKQFQPIESALPQATGYSFPSGHTQCSVGFYGALAVWHKHPLLRIALTALCVLVPFSRMYLGVHTPLDVGVSVLIALALVFGLYPLIRRTQTNPKLMRWILLTISLYSVAQVIYLTLTLHGATDARLTDGLENSYKMCGAAIGFWLAHEIETHCIRYDTHAVWWAQILKVLLGLATSLGVKAVSSMLLDPLVGTLAGAALSYGVLVIFAGAVWPLTFRFFGRLGNKEAHSC